MSLPEEIIPYVKKHYGDWDIYPLNAGGSARKYFRIENNNQTKIICKNERIHENLRFIELSEKLKAKGIPVPKVEHLSNNQIYYSQTDLGKTTLLNYRQTHKENALFYYKKALEYLVRIQRNFNVEELNDNSFFEPEYDETLIYRDLFYFKHFFVDQAKISVNNAKILKAFKNILKYSENFSKNFVMLRDFHGRNIMIHNEDTYLIDFQNAMRGFRMYDVVSLLWQAKAALSIEEKDELLNHFFNGENESNKDKLIAEYQFCAMLRGMQVLGAYGKLGLLEKKPHFLESISFGLANLHEISKFEIMNDFPYLKEIFNELFYIHQKKELC